MNTIKKMLIAVVPAVIIAAPLTVAPVVSAEPTDLVCSYTYYDGEIPGTDYTTKNCDLSIMKQVSVNGGAFLDADTAGAAATATVGDSVVWKISVTDKSGEGNSPLGIVTVTDVLPSAFGLNSYVASSGTYSANSWSFTAEEDLPATLTLTTTANTVGLAVNSATLSAYQPDNCDGPCVDPPYADSDNSNNSNSAYVNVTSKIVPPTNTTTTTTPVQPTLVNTGVNPVMPMVAALLTAVSAFGVYNYEKLRARIAKLLG